MAPSLNEHSARNSCSNPGRKECLVTHRPEGRRLTVHVAQIRPELGQLGMPLKTPAISSSDRIHARNKSAVKDDVAFAVSPIPLRVRIILPAAPPPALRCVRAPAPTGGDSDTDRSPSVHRASPRNEGPHAVASPSVNHYAWRRPFVGDRVRPQGIRGGKADLFPDDEQSLLVNVKIFCPLRIATPPRIQVVISFRLGLVGFAEEQPGARPWIFKDRKDRR